MLEALDTPYLQRALLAGVVLAVPLGLLGSWVVLRELAFFAHAVGVATFPGVVIGLVLPVLGPFAGALLAALGFSAAVSDGDVALCVVAAAVSVVVLVPLLPRLAATTFDRGWAGPAGARERATASALLFLVSLVVVCALPAVGSLLVSALLVVPAATARLMVKRLGPMLVWATGLCAAETVAGLLLARSLDLPPGAAIAVVAGLAFGLLAGGQAAASRLTRVAPA